MGDPEDQIARLRAQLRESHEALRIVMADWNRDIGRLQSQQRLNENSVAVCARQIYDSLSEFRGAARYVERLIETSEVAASVEAELTQPQSRSAPLLWNFLPSSGAAQRHHGDAWEQHRPSVDRLIREACVFLWFNAGQRDRSDFPEEFRDKSLFDCPCGGGSS